jgi:hypothetical protein
MLFSCILFFQLDLSAAGRTVETPHVLAVALRLITVRPGLTADETVRALGLQNTAPDFGGGTCYMSYFVYTLRPSFELVVTYRFDEKRASDVLVNARLGRARESSNKRSLDQTRVLGFP